MMKKLLLLTAVIRTAWSALEDHIPQTTLHGGQKLPLVGIGVGNLQHDLIVAQVSDAMGFDTRLVDTAHASSNEHLVSEGIREGLAVAGSDEVEVHVITKIWYTMLGYNRTLISIRESLKELKGANIRVHILLHWPRCRDDIPWMKCEEEEEKLPEHVKEAGPPPHLDKENAYKESWRALEDIFLGKVSLGDDLAQIESIGVSNFDINDIRGLEKVWRIAPHILQGNVWSFLFDPHLINYCRDHKIHFQAYNVMNGVLSRRDKSPHAFDNLKLLATRLAFDSDDGGHFSPSQVLLKWLIQQDVSVIPRTRSSDHLHDNSASALETLPIIADEYLPQVREAVGALLRGEDLQQPEALFVNKHSQAVNLFWSGDDGMEHLVKERLMPGEEFRTLSYPGHVFVAYDIATEQQRRFTVQANYGEREQFHVDEF
jgi:diketogulonate reductase-like aldo/keto reductase